MSAAPAYRADIDGLRAIAVLAVVMFHADVPGFPGGYVGVDVFFVISGYLIASLILKGIEDGTFTIAGFYERRARRIFPALFTVIGLTAVAALVVLPPWEIAAFAKSVLATALFGSNILFYLEAGYFAAPAEAKPLLHTWSLAVEEQYYIVFPLLMVALARWPARLPGVVLLLAALSLLASAVAVETRPVAAFYLAHYRAWELLLGVLAALDALPVARSPALRGALAWLGLILIAASVALYSEHTAFPGLAALAPCAGALLIIHTGGAGAPTAVARVLMSRPMVFVGLISYSLYLWHWPLLVFAKALAAGDPSPWTTSGVVGASFVLATLSWRFVERPFRRRGSGGVPRRTVFSSAGLAMSLALLVGLVQLNFTARAGDGAETAEIRGREDYRAGSCFLKEHQTYADWAGPEACRIGDEEGPAVLLWGDSFAAHYAPGLDALADELPVSAVQFSAYACPPVPDAEIAWAPDCRGINDAIDRVLEAVRPDVVVLGARWERYWGRFLDAADVQRTVDRLRERGMGVVLVGQGPSFSFHDPRQHVRQTRRHWAEARDVLWINDELSALSGYAAFFDPSARDCSGRQCQIFEGGRYLYWDSGHYSSAGSVRAARAMVEALRLALASVPAGRS